MEKRLLVLKLVADALGQEINIATLSERKALQKALYLGQLCGVDLGYRYGWYIRGPYSTELARDYYRLAEALEDGDDEYKERKLNDIVKAKLKSIRPLLNVPEGVQLDRASWLELLASWHFLRTVNKKSEADASQVMQREKPYLLSHVQRAETSLKDFRLLS